MLPRKGRLVAVWAFTLTCGTVLIIHPVLITAGGASISLVGSIDASSRRDG